MLTIADVRAAAAGLSGVAHRTPVLRSATLDRRTGAEVHLKAEHLQLAGAFKIRGAYTAMRALTPEQRRQGVVAYSSGNHAQAVALAGRLLGVPAVIVMPHDTPQPKLAATLEYGAEVVGYDRWTQDRHAVGEALAQERAAVLIPPYDHPLVMAGQGTAALELLEDAGDVDVLVVPIGGGGLMAGSATVARALLGSHVRIVGVEPAAGDDTRRSLLAGERVRLPVPRSIADGALAETPGALTFEVNRRLVDEVVTVSDGELVAALAFALERMKTLLEPTGALALAALLAGRVAVEGRRVGAILSGGNVALERLAELLARQAG